MKFAFCYIFLIGTSQISGAAESLQSDTLENPWLPEESALTEPQSPEPLLVTNSDSVSEVDSLTVADSTDSAESALSALLDSIAAFQQEVRCSLANLQTGFERIDLKTAALSDSLVKLDLIQYAMNSLHRSVHQVNQTVHSVKKRVNRPEKYYRDRFGIGYEEGLAFHIRVGGNGNPGKKSGGVTGGAGYFLDNQKDSFHNTLHEFHVKLGWFQEFAVFHRIRLAVYLEVMEKMKQFEAEPFFMQTRFNTYEIWATKGRLGILFNIYSLKHFMLTYRFGCELVYHTPPYIMNENRTKMEKIGKGALTFGTSGGAVSVLETILNNIGIYVYF